MATKIATYRFDNESAYNNAKERISSEIGWSGWDYSSYEYIYIYDDCEKAALVGQICRAYGGVPYN
jgi:hypothetical protein